MNRFFSGQHFWSSECFLYMNTSLGGDSWLQFHWLAYLSPLDLSYLLFSYYMDCQVCISECISSFLTVFVMLIDIFFVYKYMYYWLNFTIVLLGLAVVGVFCCAFGMDWFANFQNFCLVLFSVSYFFFTLSSMFLILSQDTNSFIYFRKTLE